MKALQYINVGYQRILTFECASGGFNWWEGDNPGNSILTAVGITMLRDTQSVYPAVDSAVIDRAKDYLVKNQKTDGSWGEERHLHAGNENLGAGTLRSTCYIAWALAEGGYKTDSSVAKAVNFISKGIAEERDMYTLGVCANALAAAGEEGSILDKLVDRIDAASIQDKDFVHWKAQGLTLVNSGGQAADVEVTALMALAYIAAERHLIKVPDIINWLASTKDPNGNWGYNTQATVLALKAFLKAATVDTSETRAEVIVTLDGEEIGRRKFDDFNRDVVWQLEFASEDLNPKNHLELRFEGTGNLGYQVVASHFVPERDEGEKVEPLSIDVAFDRATLKVDETVTLKATLTRNDAEAEGMVLVSLGTPPGFDILAEDLQHLKAEEKIALFEVTGRQVLLYLDSLPVGEQTTISYRLKARYPIKAKTGESEVRLYYNSNVRSERPAQTIEVTR